MNIRSLISKLLKKKKELKVADIVKATGFSRAYISRIFQELRKENKVVLVGKANKACYVLADKKTVSRAKSSILNVRRSLRNKNLSEDEVLHKIKRDTGIFLNLPKNVISITDYAFTEMLNNAIEHSKSQTIDVLVERDKKSIRFSVIDKGIGIFNSIIKKRNLKNELEAIQELTKGKLTTAPEKHSGEGIFFTSCVVDKLIIQNSNKKLTFDNILNDIFINDIKKLKGTKVIFLISAGSKRQLQRIFKKYAGETFEFVKTKVVVKLYKTDTGYISRSQARRILTGLEKFKTVTLDFHNVNTVGQAFADEIFRVWQNRHPNIKIQYQNANENIIFMVKRAKEEVRSSRR